MPLDETGPLKSLFPIVLTGQKRVRIAGTVQDPDDDDFSVGIAVIKSVVPEKMDAQAGSQVIPGGADLGMGKQRRETLAKLAHKRVRRLRIVGGDEGPDLGEILFGLVG